MGYFVNWELNPFQLLNYWQMLPVYQAISFQQVITEGGRTRPWIVLVDTGQGLAPYVVKLFTTEEIGRRDSVANEVLGHVLARAFDLPTPDAALIDFTDAFVASLTDFELLEVLHGRDRRLKYGCALMEGFFRFDPGRTSVETRKMIDMDTVFAFDNLIRNPDRNAVKPNILAGSHEVCLIDHELGFEIDTSTNGQLLRSDWPERFYRWHIFRPYLLNSWQKNKSEYFHEFEEYLKYLTINDLKPFLEQLGNCGFSPAKHDLLLDYLSLVKKNSTTFVQMIRTFVT